MQVALHTNFAASRKEPLADVVERIHAAILAAGFGEPFVQFIMADSPVPGGVSSLDRALKRFPQLERFVHDQFLPGSPDRRVISNGDSSGAAGEALDFAILAEIARGVPRSLPFHKISLQLRFPALGPEVALPFPLGLVPGGLKPAIMVTDSWWVNGRQRGVSALTVIEAEPSAKKLPALPPGVAAVFAACGKTRKTDQIPLAAPSPPGSADGAARAAIIAVQRDFRARLGEIVERAGLPHDLPPTREAITARTAYVSGPKKPALVEKFAPLGYNCRGESGTFTLRRRTPENLTVELSLDVGTWSNMVTAFFHVHGMVNGLGFTASVPMPVARQATVGGQYPIGGPDQWQQIVANLAALALELDRSLTPAILAVSGAAPDWYRPEG